MKDKHAAALRVAKSLRAFEHATDKALAAHGRMVAAIASAPRQGGVSATVGHDIFEAAAAIAPALVEVRGRSVAMHHRLAVVQRALRISMSPADDKEPRFASSSDGPHLEVVSSNVA